MIRRVVSQFDRTKHKAIKSEKRIRKSRKIVERMNFISSDLQTIECEAQIYGSGRREICWVLLSNINCISFRIRSFAPTRHIFSRFFITYALSVTPKTREKIREKRTTDAEARIKLMSLLSCSSLGLLKSF